MRGAVAWLTRRAEKVKRNTITKIAACAAAVAAFSASAVEVAQDDAREAVRDWEPVTRDFIFYLRSQPLLKGLLTGHHHFDVQDRVSPTASQYVVGGNFLFHGQEITIA